jgi:glycosyltransferase involved in cell wall biosynthesis
VIAGHQSSWPVRHVHEQRSGVVHARNRAVAEARGDYVIFLDDDEVPSPGWLDAWMAQADGTTDAAFGRIVPRLLAPCPAELLEPTMRAFSRDMRAATGADITSRSAYVGTGNAMFHRTRCFVGEAPFDLRFNARGGEDVWLIRSLAQRGLRLLWNHEALVEELVPASRMTLASALTRRFNQGQLRGILNYGEGGLGGLLRVIPWMGVGAVQVGLFGAGAWIAAVAAPDKAASLRCRVAGGAGKLQWWRRPGQARYAA